MSQSQSERVKDTRRDRMRAEFLALPQEISVAGAEYRREDCEDESMSVVWRSPHTLLSLTE